MLKGLATSRCTSPAYYHFQTYFQLILQSFTVIWVISTARSKTIIFLHIPMEIKPPMSVENNSTQYVTPAVGFLHCKIS